MKNTKDAKTQKIGDDLVITRKTRRVTVGGSWIKGTVAGYQFDALVFFGACGMPLLPTGIEPDLEALAQEDRWRRDDGQLRPRLGHPAANEVRWQDR